MHGIMTTRGRIGVGRHLQTLLAIAAAVCVVELLCAATAWLRLLDVAVAWAMLCAMIQRARDIGRTWRLPAAILLTTSGGLAIAAYGVIIHAFGNGSPAPYMVTAGVLWMVAIILLGKLAFSLPVPPGERSTPATTN